MLVLPMLRGSLRSYIRAVGIPIIVTLACIAAFVEITEVFSVGDWAQLGLGAMLAILGMVGSACVQGKGLVREVELLRGSTAGR
jgi:hypothetical protein